MSLLQTESSLTVGGIPELRGLEAAMSRQSIELYDGLSRRMAEFGNGDAAAAFERIASLERERATTDAPPAAEEPPAILLDEDLGSSRLVTPYAAYGLAVRNAARLASLWTYVAAHAVDAEVQAEAERLAVAANQRINGLRSSRRLAFHDDRPAAASAADLRAATPAELESQAGSTEAALSLLHHRIAAELARQGDSRAQMIAGIAEEEAESARQLGVETPAAGMSEALPEDADALVDLASVRLEASVELYLTVAENSQQQDVVAIAQDLANRAIARLTALR